MDSTTLLSFTGIVTIVVAIVTALAIGGRPERVGAIICVVGGLLTMSLQNLSPTELPFYAFLIVDLGMAVAFTALAIRNPEKFWPGAAAVSQTLLAAFSATRAIGFPLSEAGYTAALNISSMGVGLALGIGAVLSRRPPTLVDELV